MQTSRESICILLRTWIPVLLFFSLANATHADPLHRLTGDVPGSEPWWILPGSDVRFSDSPSTDFTLSLSESQVVRYKEDEQLRYLLTSDGPSCVLSHTGRNSYYRLGWLGQNVDAFFFSGGENNRLDGDRSLTEFGSAFYFPLKNRNGLILGASYYRYRLSADGVLPAMVNGIPGFEDDDVSSLNWREDGFSLGLTYQKEESSIGISYAHSDNRIELLSESPDDLIRLGVEASGSTFGISGEMPLDSQTIGEAYFYTTQNSGEDGVYRRESELGPMRASQDSWCGGFSLESRDKLPEWRLSVTRGIHRTVLYGSANISSFAEPVFGIVTPRVHIDAAVKLSLSSVIYERDGGEFADADITWFLGATRWDLEGDIRTWESYLFGSAILNETVTPLDAESGWLVHAGFSADWELTKRDSLLLHVAQTVPVSITRTIYPGPPGEPGPDRRTVWDGGRYIYLGYIHSF